MSSVILTGDTSGTLTLSAPLVAGSNTVTLPAATGTISLLTQGTSVTASGTSVDFTGIPSWAKRITVMFNGLSTSGTSNYLVQLGDAGGVENTGYVSAVNNGGSSATSTAGFLFTQSTLAASLQSGSMIISLLGSNTWVEQGCGVIAAGGMCFMAGSKTLSDTLTQVRITTVNGTDTFDAGSINVMWEG
jgi:hypothetical protein